MPAFCSGTSARTRPLTTMAMPPCSACRRPRPARLMPWYALAKSARWRHSYAAAAEFARQGFGDGPIAPMSVQLASYEANSAALLGDQARARQALARAEFIAELLPS